MGDCGHTPRCYRSSSTARSNRTSRHPLRRLRTGGCFCASVVSRGPPLYKISANGANNGRLEDRNDRVPTLGDLTYRFYPVVIFTPFSYLKYLNRNGFRLVSSPPGPRGSGILSRHGFVPRDTDEDVRRWYNPVATANPAKMRQASTLQLSVRLFVGVQDLECGTIQLEIIGDVVEDGM